jgi:hypothetical protein
MENQNGKLDARHIITKEEEYAECKKDFSLVSPTRSRDGFGGWLGHGSVRTPAVNSLQHIGPAK